MTEIRYRSFAAMAIIALGAVSGCALDYQALAPFPCPADRACPAGLSCVPGVGCTTAGLDAPCSAETDCTAAGAGAVCESGLCVPQCTAGIGCPADRSCSSASAAGGCLLDCTAQGSCPEGLVCQDVYYDGRRGCLPPDQAVPACTAFESLAPLRFCGGGNFTSQCPNGSQCPADSFCIANNQCVCNPGYKAVSCDGQSCSGACSYPNWWCVPESVSGTCAARSGWGPQVMHCADGRATPTDCATQASCETWCATRNAGCDTVTQNCRAASAPRCNLVVDSSGNAATGCVARLGNLAPGAACQSSGGGLDDCAPGSLCTDFGAPPGTRTCRQFCRRDEQCPASFHCLAVSELTPQDGVCLPDCQLYSSCPSQLSCTPYPSLTRQLVGYCRAVGSGGSAAACQDDTDCAADLSCEPNGASRSCVELCDSNHPCARGSCSAFHNTTLLSAAGECS